ncbi:ABC transporter ATP-binding protein [Pelagibacterium lentulum]|uniref:Fe3+/spermidine/putrescine ABC transporter ATP-binding protein n=1 Tax=Pelagibacterium lentulum TaxID=2029865 RepID=A0A916RLF6_9HYPH|nr:ABC transporter ATP-binding protein [Pelagibacterium lentulum]GGA60922.1 Fe3+/spermidine/putrescine ABC transporter ATP-binding protein [Pelagibacterium lentulum]
MPAPTATSTPVNVAGISQKFGDVRVLNAVDLDIAAGETVALLGDSGSGKTTLLRLIAGLARPTGGSIHIGERCVADARTGAFLPPEARGLGMVFQDYALWPHMSVARNVGFPLEMRGISKAKREPKVREALSMVNLDAFADRQPGTLSGGQQQRVALARAIVAQPSVILFDEPLSNLDRHLREHLVVDIATLLRRLGMTAVYVTHDHSEAFALADRVAVLRGGGVLQIDAPEALVARPASIAVAEFLKLGLVLEGEVDSGEMVLGQTQRLKPPADFLNGSRTGHLFVPRNAIHPARNGDSALRTTALHSAFKGDGYAVQLQLDHGPILDFFSQTRIDKGAPVDLTIAWERARWFPSTNTHH